MKGTVKILNGSGHATVEYDTEEGVVAEAEKALNDAWLKRSAMFDGDTRKQIKTPRRQAGEEFPKTGHDKILAEHEEILIVPSMAGGR